MDTIELTVRVPAPTMKIIKAAADEQRAGVDDFVVLGAYRHAVALRGGQVPPLDMEQGAPEHASSLEP